MPEPARKPEQQADSRETAVEIARLADSKKAAEIVICDMRELVSYTDYLVICTAANERQASAISDEVYLRMKNDRGLLANRSGEIGEAGWTVIDYLDCVLHIFTEEARRRYDLEDLWHEAPRVGFEAAEVPSDGASTVSFHG